MGDDFLSNDLNDNHEIIIKLGNLSVKKDKNFHQEQSKYMILQSILYIYIIFHMKLDFLRREKLSPQKIFESFDEYITPKNMIVMEKYVLGNEESENEEEKLLKEMYSSKKSYHLDDVLAITGLSKKLDIKKKILY